MGIHATWTDWFIFVCLQSLGITAIAGNLALIVVLLRNKYLNRASFILMLSLAIADVLHGVVTTCHFYPPIVWKQIHLPEMGIRIFNIIDWTAWAVTLTHMSAICIDRLIAIGLYGRYNTIVTIPRVRNYTLACWTVFLTTNGVFFFMGVCCMIRPLESQNFYSFGYAENEEKVLNFYVLTYTPIEIITIAILSVSNPITLYQLYKRHKRKVALRQHGAQKTSVSESNSSLLKQQRSQWQRFQASLTAPPRLVASTMLLEMSMKMGSKNLPNDVREIAARRANRQQQRILLQISVVALIFYAYMTVYYVLYYSQLVKSITAVLFNSFCYSFTHMVNPIIYFSLNKEMRAQLRVAFSDLRQCLLFRRKDPYEFDLPPSKKSQTKMTSCADHNKASASSCSETSPLFSTVNQYKSTGETTLGVEDAASSASGGPESAEIQAIVNAASDDSEECPRILEEYESNKMTPRERSMFLSQLTKALQFSSKQSIRKDDSWISHTDAEGPKMARGRFMKISQTMQVLSKESLACPRFNSMTHLDTRPLIYNPSSSNSNTTASRSSYSAVSSLGQTSSERQALLDAGMVDSSDDEDIAFL